MKEFMLAALPWICIGIGIALCMVNHATLKKAKEEGDDYDNYMGIGMCFGMCVGSILGGNATSYGMLIGLIVGMFVKKEKHT